MPTPFKGAESNTGGRTKASAQWTPRGRRPPHAWKLYAWDCFGSFSHDWIVKFLQHRIGDRRILRLIKKWLRAGVLEDGVWSQTDKGTPQGSVISPLLCNVYLHYVFDLWAQHWRTHRAKGEVKIALWRCMHQPLAEVGKWLRSVVQGYFNYHAVPDNLASLRHFRTEVSKRWLQVLRRRSQRSRISWELMAQFVDQWLPQPQTLHPYPTTRFFAKHPR